MPGLLMLPGQAEVDGQAVRIAPASIPKEGYFDFAFRERDNVTG